MTVVLRDVDARVPVVARLRVVLLPASLAISFESILTCSIFLTVERVLRTAALVM